MSSRGAVDERRITVGDATFKAQILHADPPSPQRPVVVLLFADEQSRLPAVSLLQERFRLTPREAEVASLLKERKSNKEIARALGVTLFTAERHTERVLGKLGVNSRRLVQAAILARQ